MPEQISGYRVESEIARGGMGIVYRCVHTVLGDEVAIKAIFPDLMLNPELRARFMNEAKIQYKLHHPNIVQLREFLIEEGQFYIVMECIEGETLAHVIRQLGRPMQANEAIEIFYQALEGLGFAHAQGVIHRDIKPSNIMVTREGVAKLTDFGIARGLDTAKLTRTGTALGTAPYMSPEQIRGTKLDHRTDIYSMGITLYEMLTGRVPFERPADSDSDYPILTAHISQAPLPPSRLVPDIPPFLEAAILKAMEKQPEDRFGSCREFQAAIAPPPAPEAGFVLPPTEPAWAAPSPAPAGGGFAVPSSGGDASGPVPSVPSATLPLEPRSQPEGLAPETPGDESRTGQRSRALWASLAAVVVVILAALVWVLWPHPPQRENTEVRLPPVTAPPANPNPPKLEAKPAQVVVETVPGAQVYLDDALAGQADPQGRLAFDDLKPGEHGLRVSFAGRKDYEQRVTTVAGQQTTFQAPLHDQGHPLPATPVQTPRPSVTTSAGATVRENPKDGLKYVWIPPGTFMMGCSPGDNECTDDERPLHRVTITRGFQLGQTEVPVAAYQRFAASTGRHMPPPPDFNSGWANDTMPIVMLTWEDAHDYCTWAGGRLPTEAEWEYAARGGSTEARFAALDQAAWYGANSGGQTHPVGEKQGNRFGLYDVLGNVWEWVNDWYAPMYYQSSPYQGPAGPASGQERVLRGGSYYDFPREVRVSRRGRGDPGDRDGAGVRCVW